MRNKTSRYTVFAAWDFNYPDLSQTACAFDPAACGLIALGSASAGGLQPDGSSIRKNASLLDGEGMDVGALWQREPLPLDRGFVSTFTFRVTNRTACASYIHDTGAAAADPPPPATPPATTTPPAQPPTYTSIGIPIHHPQTGRCTDDESYRDAAGARCSDFIGWWCEQDSTREHCPISCINGQPQCTYPSPPPPSPPPSPPTVEPPSPSVDADGCAARIGGSGLGFVVQSSADGPYSLGCAADGFGLWRRQSINCNDRCVAPALAIRFDTYANLRMDTESAVLKWDHHNQLRVYSVDCTPEGASYDIGPSALHAVDLGPRLAIDDGLYHHVEVRYLAETLTVKIDGHLVLYTEMRLTEHVQQERSGGSGGFGSGGVGSGGAVGGGDAAAFELLDDAVGTRQQLQRTIVGTSQEEEAVSATVAADGSTSNSVGGVGGAAPSRRVTTVGVLDGRGFAHLGLVASSGSIGHEQYEIGSWAFERAVVMPEERSRLPLTEREAAVKRREEAEMAAAEAARQPPPPPPPQQPPPPPDQPPPEDIVVDSGSGSGEAGSGFAATGDGASGSGDEVVGGGGGGGGEAASGSGE